MTRGSTCSWVVRAVSRLPPATNCRPIQTRFPCGYGPEVLNRAADGNSPDHYAKGTPSRIAYAIALRPLVGTWFQVHIPPLAGVLLIFQSPYWFTIGRQRVFSLTGWSPWIQSRFHVTGPTQVSFGRRDAFRIRGCHPLWPIFPDRSTKRSLGNFTMKDPTTPQGKPPRFGLFRFRSPLLTESIFLSFPPVT